MKLLHIYRKTYHSHKLTIHIKCSPSCNYNTVICWEFHFGFRKTNLTNMVKETSSASCTTAISSWIPGPLKFSWIIMFWTFRVIYGLFTIVPKLTVQSSELFFPGGHNLIKIHSICGSKWYSQWLSYNFKLCFPNSTIKHLNYYLKNVFDVGMS